MQIVCIKQGCQTLNDESADYCAKCQALLPAVVANQTFFSDLGDFKVLEERHRDTVSTSFLVVVSRSSTLGLERGMKCMLKEYLPKSIDDPYAQHEFSRIAESIKQLSSQSQSLVPLRGHFIQKSRFYTIEDHVAGTALDHGLSHRSTYSEQKTLDIMRKLAEALDELHEKNIFHGDISPSTVLCSDADSRLLLGDFGSLKDATQLVKPNGHYTLNPEYLLDYMPPERADRGLCAASDVYLLGATAIGLLCGKPLSELYDPAKEQWVLEGAKVDACTQLLLKRMTVRPTAKRIETARNVLDMLERIRASREYFDLGRYSDYLDELRRMNSPKSTLLKRRIEEAEGLFEWQERLEKGKTCYQSHQYEWAAREWKDAYKRAVSLARSRELKKIPDLMKSITELPGKIKNAENQLELQKEAAERKRNKYQEHRNNAEDFFKKRRYKRMAFELKQAYKLQPDDELEAKIDEARRLDKWDYHIKKGHEFWGWRDYERAAEQYKTALEFRGGLEIIERDENLNQRNAEIKERLDEIKRRIENEKQAPPKRASVAVAPPKKSGLTLTAELISLLSFILLLSVPPVLYLIKGPFQPKPEIKEIKGNGKIYAKGSEVYTVSADNPKSMNYEWGCSDQSVKIAVNGHQATFTTSNAIPRDNPMKIYVTGTDKYGNTCYREREIMVAPADPTIKYIQCAICENSDVRQGDVVTLLAEAEDPKAGELKFDWRVDNLRSAVKKIPKDNGRISTLDILGLQPIHKSHPLKARLVVTDVEGKSDSEDYIIELTPGSKGSPDFPNAGSGNRPKVTYVRPQSNDQYYVTFGQSVTFEAHATSPDNSEVTYEWSSSPELRIDKNGQTATLHTAGLKSPSGQTRVTVTVIVKNKRGASYGQATITVGSPKAP